MGIYQLNTIATLVHLWPHRKVIFVYEPNFPDLRMVLIFSIKKSATEGHRMLLNTYSETAVSQRTSPDRFFNVVHIDSEVSILLLMLLLASELYHYFATLRSLCETQGLRLPHTKSNFC